MILGAFLGAIPTTNVTQPTLTTSAGTPAPSQSMIRCWDGTMVVPGTPCPIPSSAPAQTTTEPLPMPTTSTATTPTVVTVSPSPGDLVTLPSENSLLYNGWFWAAVIGGGAGVVGLLFGLFGNRR